MTITSAFAQNDESAALAASLEYTKSVIAKQRLIVRARFEPVEGDGKAVEFRYDRYPHVERIEHKGVSYARKSGKKWLVSDDWGETGKPAKEKQTQEFQGWIALIDAPLENRMVSRDQSQGGLRVFRSGESSAGTSYEIRREHSTGMLYPKFTFTKSGEQELLKSFTGTMFLGEDKVMASMRYDYMISVNATVIPPESAADDSPSPAPSGAQKGVNKPERSAAATLASAMRLTTFRPFDVEATIAGVQKRKVRGLVHGKNFDLTVTSDDGSAPTRRIAVAPFAWSSTDGGKSWKRSEAPDRSPYDWVTALLIADGLPAFEAVEPEEHGGERWEHFRLKVDEQSNDESVRPHYWVALDREGKAAGVRRYEGPGIIKGEVVTVKATYRPSKEAFVKAPALLK